MQKKNKGNFVTLAEQMAKRGFKLRTWAKSKGLKNSDCLALYDLSNGTTKGKWGRAKELKEMLEKEGFKVA